MVFWHCGVMAKNHNAISHKAYPKNKSQNMSELYSGFFVLTNRSGGLGTVIV